MKTFKSINLEPPKIIQFQPTNLCNLNCLFCDHRKVENELPDSKWLQMAYETGKMGTKKITITGGGEPMMRPQLTLNLMKKIKQFTDVKGDIVTNGTLFKSNHIKEIVSISWDNITFSVHGANKKTDDYLRGKKGSFNATLKVVKLINYWKKKLGCSKPKLNFLMVINRYNFNQVAHMVKLVSKLNLSGLCIKLVNEGPNLKRKMSMKKNQIPIFKLEVEKAKTLAKNLGIEFFTDFSEEDLKIKHNDMKEKPVFKKSKPYCTMPFFELVIFSNGKASPCCIFYTKEGENKEFIEDVRNKNLGDAWNGKIFNELRKSMIDNLPPKTCLGCTPDIGYRNETWYSYITGSKALKENISRYL